MRLNKEVAYTYVDKGACNKCYYWLIKCLRDKGGNIGSHRIRDCRKQDREKHFSGAVTEVFHNECCGNILWYFVDNDSNRDDKPHILRYHGAQDDNSEDHQAVRQHSLREAVIHGMFLA